MSQRENPFFLFKKSAGLLWSVSPPKASLLLALSVFQGALPLGLIYCIKLLIDLVLKMATQASSSIFDPLLLWLLVVTSAVFFFNQFFSSIIHWITESYVIKITECLFGNIHQKSVKQAYANFENPVTQDMAFRARNELAFRPESLLKNFLGLVQSGVSFALAVGLIVFLNPVIALFLIVLFIPGLWFKIKFAHLQFRNKRKRTPLERLVMYFSRVLTDPVFAKEIRMFLLGKHFSEKFRINYTQLGKMNLKEIKQRSIADFFSQAFATILMLGAILWITNLAITGKISSGDLVMYILVFQRGMTFLRSILSFITGIYEDILGLSNYFEFMELASEPELKNICRQDGLSLHPGIEFKSVVFCYPGNNKEILKNVSLHFPAGKITLLVGPNGSGKTTIIKLLCKLYQPVSGSVLIDGIDLSALETEKYLSHVTALFQDFVLYHQTAGENISFGDIQKLPDLDNLSLAAEKAGIKKLLQNLPDKFATNLGFLFPNSVELSMGQWQRLALARAFYKDSGIVLLDEPSSAMDAIAEDDFYHRLHELIKGKTAIIVSHRLSFAHLADQIILLNENGTVEVGSHGQLINANGVYAQMYSNQSGMYKK